MHERSCRIDFLCPAPPLQQDTHSLTTGLHNSVVTHNQNKPEPHTHTHTHTHTRTKAFSNSVESAESDITVSNRETHTCLCLTRTVRDFHWMFSLPDPFKPLTLHARSQTLSLTSPLETAESSRCDFTSQKCPRAREKIIIKNSHAWKSSKNNTSPWLYSLRWPYLESAAHDSSEWDV